MRASAKLGSTLAHIMATSPTPEALVAKPSIPTLFFLAGRTLRGFSWAVVWEDFELGVGNELSP